jgi:cytochrome P450
MHDRPNHFWPPSQPGEPHLDPAKRTWTLSRYAEVDTALRESSLRQATVEGKDTDVADDPRHQQLVLELRADTERLHTAYWRGRMAHLARILMNRAAAGAPVNLVSGVILPWSTTVGLEFSGADGRTRLRLGDIAERLSHAHDNPDVSIPLRRFGWSIAKLWFDWRHRRAERQLQELINKKRVHIGRAFYASATQTLPGFLAKAWLALLLHPEQMDLLRRQPERMPAAVDELLRYAGLVRSLHRRATADMRIGPAAVAQGDLVSLKMESANRDPAKFTSPERLDITRKPAGNLGLGVGTHACPGAAIVRLALTVTTPVFLAALPCLATDNPVEWKGDTTVAWPAVIPVLLNKQPGKGEIEEFMAYPVCDKLI